MRAGIEAIHFYSGQASLDVRMLFERRGLSLDRFDTLMMRHRSVGLPCEDPVTHAVNAAKPIVSRLTEAERSRIEMVIAATESGLDFGKGLSTYVHDYLGLGRRCRLFEVKQACYAGTAAVQMAAAFVASGVSPGAKALVVATDVAVHHERSPANYAEPTMGTGAAAILISDRPNILELDLGASGYHSYEVMDTCRPAVGHEEVNVDLSLLSYTDCLEGAYRAYADRVEGADYLRTFQYLAFHTPFAGLVKSAHRKMMRTFAGAKAEDIAHDFERRVLPSLRFCMQVGNVYSATLYLALCGVLEHANLEKPQRIGLFSYGSGCSSEFFSGVLRPEGCQQFRELGFAQALADRYPLRFEEYELLMDLNARWGFGIRDQISDDSLIGDIYARKLAGKGLLVLDRVENYYRKYRWS